MPAAPRPSSFNDLVTQFKDSENAYRKAGQGIEQPMTLEDYRIRAMPAKSRNAQRAPVRNHRALVAQAAYTKRVAADPPEKIQEVVDDMACKYELPAKLITAMIKVESGFNPRAVSPEGACGLMQLMPGTARMMGVKNVFEIRQNVEGGCRYMKQLMDQFDGDVELALAAYNAGPSSVEKYRGVPPYRQTRSYVKKVLAHC